MLFYFSLFFSIDTIDNENLSKSQMKSGANSEFYESKDSNASDNHSNSSAPCVPGSAAGGKGPQAFEKTSSIDKKSSKSYDHEDHLMVITNADDDNIDFT